MKINNDIFFRNLISHRDTLQKLDIIADTVSEAGVVIAETLISGGRVFFCGNGGSAADAQHLAAEFSGRYMKERRPLDGIALHCNTSALTAIGNDYSFDEVFARQLMAHGRKGDLLVAISTSGNSSNVVKAIEEAKKLGIFTVGMTGSNGGSLRDAADMLIAVPSDSTPRVQEMHIMIGHILCEIAEELVARAETGEVHGVLAPAPVLKTVPDNM